MKLYTEEQVRIALDLSAKGIDLVLCDDILSYVKHIKLPSDEEIKKILDYRSDEYASGYYGAINMIEEQIKQQDNV